jgi:hypothetical protein
MSRFDRLYFSGITTSARLLAGTLVGGRHAGDPLVQSGVAGMAASHNTASHNTASHTTASHIPPTAARWSCTLPRKRRGELPVRIV